MKTVRKRHRTDDVVMPDACRGQLPAEVLVALGCTVSFSDREFCFPEGTEKKKAERIVSFLSSPSGTYASFYLTERGKEISAQPLRHNAVDIGESFALQNGLLNNQIVFVLFPSDFSVVECTVHINPSVTRACEIRLPTALKEYEDTTIVLLCPAMYVCDRVRSQKVSCVREDIVSVSEELYDALSAFSPDCLEFRHLATGATMMRRFGCVRSDPDLLPGQIRLTYYQREILNIVDSQKGIRPPAYFVTLYDKVTRTTARDVFFDEEKTRVSDAYNRIQIVPVQNERRARRSLFDRFCDLTVGTAAMNLSCVRPYKIDDSRDIVRLSEDTMTLLGIEESDRVILRYKDKVCKAGAMKIDSYELMKETNILDSVTDLDYIVGIPVPLRRYLGVGDIETEVTVERDTSFLFFKNLNIQMLSVLGLFLAVFQIGSSLTAKIIACVLLLPLIIYVSLSQERSKVKKYGKQRRE